MAFKFLCNLFLAPDRLFFIIHIRKGKEIIIVEHEMRVKTLITFSTRKVKRVERENGKNTQRHFHLIFPPRIYPRLFFNKLFYLFNLKEFSRALFRVSQCS